MFDNVKIPYNPKRKHEKNRMLSPIEFVRQQMTKREGVQEARGYSIGGVTPAKKLKMAM